MIRIFIRQNSIHSFTWRVFLPDSQDFQMWRLGFASIHSTEAFYRYDFSWFFSGFPSWRLALSALHKVHRSCECLKNKTFTPGPYEFQQETRSVWRGEYFFREIINVYTRANSVFSKQFAAFFSMIDSLRLPSRILREVLFTTRRLFRRAPWLGKTSPGLVWTTPGLVWTTPGLVWTTPGLVWTTPGLEWATPGLVWRPIRISPQIFYCPFRTPTRYACIPHGTQPFFRPQRRPNHCAVLPGAVFCGTRA